MTRILTSGLAFLAHFVGLSLIATDALAAGDEADNRGAFVAAGKLGGIVPFSKLGVHANAAIELGYAFGPKRCFVGYLEASYAVPQADGSGSDARVPDEKWSWNLWQKQLVLQPTFAYRLTNLGGKLVPYAGIGPRIYFLQTVTEGKAGGEALGTTKEQSTKIGIGLPIGAEWRLGPGGLFAELQLQWAPLDHRITGDTNLGATTLFIGYRAMF